MTRRQQALTLVGGLLLAACATVALWLVAAWVRRPPSPPPLLQGQIEATTVDVASKIPARVDAVTVRIGDRVTRGQPLVMLDSPEVRAKLAQAQGAQMSAQSLEDKARRGARPAEIQAAEANWQRALVAVDFAEKTFARLDRLHRDGVVPAQRRDEAEAGLRSARDAARAARAAYDLALEGAREEDRRAAAGQVAQARGVVAEVEAILADTVLTAPIDGEVTARNVNPGELVGPGAPLVSILDLTDLWAVFHVREDRLNGLKVGDRFEATVPALGGRTIAFEISSVAAQADFATWRATSAQGGFDLRTFEVRARPTVSIEALRPGMSVLTAAIGRDGAAK